MAKLNFRRCSLLIALFLASCSLTTDFDRFKGFGAAEHYSDASDPATVGDGATFDAAVDAAVEPPLEPGAVRVTRTGEGVVSSLPAGIDCGLDCVQAFAIGTPVTLTATPADGFGFVGWGGACTDFAPSEPCELTTGDPLEVSAEFAPAHELIVVRAGHGSGVVTSEDGRIRCDGTASEVCTTMVPDGVEVVLTGKASEDGSMFSGWGGACMGTAACELTMRGPKMVNAVFDSEGEVSLIVSKIGAGEGTVESAPLGIACGNDCSEAFVTSANAEVVLTATPFDGSTLVAFTGCESVSGASCTVRMSAVRSVNVEFALVQHTLSVAWAGKGAGRVTATAPEGLTCEKPAACSAKYDHGTQVTLTAAPSEGSTFVSWSGGGCGESASCTVTLGDDALVVANFALKSYAVTVGAVGEGEVLCDGMLCMGEFMAEHGTRISFGTEPETGWQLDEWEGACSAASASGPCELTITKITNVIAAFKRKSYAVRLTIDGQGEVSGTLTHAGSATPITCGSGTCEFSAAHGDALALTAKPDSDHNFAGWSGQCGGTDGCNVASIGAALQLTASFSPAGEKVLAVKKTGKGTVTSTPAGIACGSACAGANASFASGSTVKLTAESAAGYGFTGFTGCTVGASANECTVQMSSDVQDVSVAFKANSVPVAVSVVRADGKGQGSITATGISCSLSGGDCSESRAFDSTLELTAKTASDSEFVAWGGDCSGVSETCTLAIDKVGGMNVTASFRKKSYAVAVTRSGGFDNANTVSFAPTGIGCNSSSGDCRVFDHGTAVTLTATPGTGSNFVRWTNDAGAGPCHNATNAECTIDSLQAAQALTAQFNVRVYGVVVSVEGPGGVSSGEATPRIKCSAAGGSDCTAVYAHGANVSLTATAPAGARFVGWGGACAEYKEEPTCSVSMAGARSVTAEFKRVRKLSVQLLGSGVGTLAPLVSGTGGIACAVRGGVCAMMFDEGTSITLTATAPKWAAFVRFSDNCKISTGTTCGLKLVDDTSVQATFDPLGALVFVTSSTVTGNFANNRGAAHGDTVCAELAKKQELPGPWVAWLSDKKTHPLTFKNRPGRLLKLTVDSTTPLVRPDGLFVAKGGFPELVAGKLQNPILIDEAGLEQTGEERNTGAMVWTGTLPSGFSNGDDSPYCDAWSSAAKTSSIPEGVGNTLATDSAFTYKEGGIVGPIKGVNSCDKAMHLYCVRDIAVASDNK